MTLTFPAGTIRTACPEGGSCGIEWSAISKWKAQIEAAAAEFEVPAERIAATIVIESRGNRDAVQQNNQNGWSFGLLQVVPRWWKALIEQLAGKTFANENAAGQAMIDDPGLAIRAGSAVLSGYFDQHGTWDRASSAFFLGNPDWRGQDTVNSNTGAAYRASLNGLMEELSMTDAWQPVIYNLRNTPDAARFGLARWQADTIIGKCYPGRNGLRPEVIVLHVQDGWTSGSLTHWLSVTASSTVMVQQDGSILKVIAEADGPWTNGDVDRPALIAQTAMNRFGRDLNPVALTIEAEDGGTRTINAAQRKTILWLCGQWIAKYPQIAVPDDVLGHYQINSVVKINCGLYRDDIAHALADGADPGQPPAAFVGLPAWLPEDYFKVAFPLADPAGVVTKKVIAVIQETKQVPVFLGKLDVGNNRNIWRFEGFNLLNNGSRVWREGEAA